MLGQLPWLVWPSVVAHGIPYGKNSQLPRNLQDCCANLFYLHFIRSTLRQIHPWKRGSTGDKIKSFLIEKLFFYPFSAISTLCSMNVWENTAWEECSLREITACRNALIDLELVFWHHLLKISDFWHT